MNFRYLLASLALVPAALATGCGSEDLLESGDGPEDNIGSTQQALAVTPDNIMPQNGGNPAAIDENEILLGHLWQHPLNDTGFADVLELSGVKDLFITGSAASLMEEIVKCALDPQQELNAKITDDIEYTWKGEIGLCSSDTSGYGNWRDAPAYVGPASLNIVSACVLARMNSLGKHVPISMRLPHVTYHTYMNKYLPVTSIQVQTEDRYGALITSFKPCTGNSTDTCGWQADYVGICTQGQPPVTLQRNGAMKVRVCKGIYGCNPGQADFVKDIGVDETITFQCPNNASTAPNGKPGYTYFGIMVAPVPGGSLPDSDRIVSISGATTYPATEEAVFTYPEGGFYGNIFPSSDYPVKRWACYSETWQKGKAYLADRLCADPDAEPESCFLSDTPLPCPKDCTGRTSAPESAYENCRFPYLEYRAVFTVFLNEPTAISTHPVASAIVSTHDVCTPGVPLAKDSSPIATSVCAVDPYCCNAAWDSRCIDEIQSHPVCTTGAALTNACNAVVTSICAVDPYCCNTEWDSICVGEVQTVANSPECGTAGPCSHPVCTTGAALQNGCSPVVTKVCAADPYCCNNAWDATCVNEVQTVANSMECSPAQCSHPVCTTGTALANGCSPVVTKICAVDPYCCNTKWDNICIGEVQSVANNVQCVTGTCGHTLCTAGNKLTSGCDVPPLLSPGCVYSVCKADPYCCNTAWDSACVGEVNTVCGKTCN